MSFPYFMSTKPIQRLIIATALQNIEFKSLDIGIGSASQDKIKSEGNMHVMAVAINIAVMYKL